MHNKCDSSFSFDSDLTKIKIILLINKALLGKVFKSMTDVDICYRLS